MPCSAPSFVVVDYEMGNLQSVANALRFLGAAVAISSDPAELERADAVILPGVGAFGAAMESLRRLKLIDALHKQVLERRKPFLGICLGMQLVAETSEELGHFKGLGWVPGHVRRLAPPNELRIPHVGWNVVEVRQEAPLYRNLSADESFYFVHSYYFDCDERYVSAVCRYGVPFTASIQHRNIFAAQFHPEKSQEGGLRLLRNFITHVRDRSLEEQPAA